MSEQDISNDTSTTEYDAALDAAVRHARAWLASVQSRPVAARAGIEEITKKLGEGLPDGPTPAEQVVDEMAAAAEPGLVAMGSGRFFGFVIGGTLPAALGADWLTSAWDQNSGMRSVTPAVTALGDLARRWLLELLDLPSQSSVGWVTGATSANFSALAAARYRVLERAGWNVEADGCRVRRRSGCWSAPRCTARSRSRCGCWAWARRSRSPPTTRAGCGRTPWPRPSPPGRSGAR